MKTSQLKTLAVTRQGRMMGGQTEAPAHSPGRSQSYSVKATSSCRPAVQDHSSRLPLPEEGQRRPPFRPRQTREVQQHQPLEALEQPLALAHALSEAPQDARTVPSGSWKPTHRPRSTMQDSRWRVATGSLLVASDVVQVGEKATLNEQTRSSEQVEVAKTEPAAGTLSVA